MQPMNIIVCSLRIRRERPAVFRGAGCHLEKRSVQLISAGAAITGLPRKKEAGSAPLTRSVGHAAVGDYDDSRLFPGSRGRSERMFRTHQDRLTRELACITLRAWKRPIVISEKSICRLTTGSLSKNPRRKVPFYPWWALISRTSFANIMNGPLPRITVSALRG